MKTLTIAVDVDETVCDMLGAICARGVFGGDALNEDHILPEDISTWDLPEWMYDYMDYELYDTWAMPIKGAREAINRLRKQGHRVVFVSSCYRGTADAKKEWLVRWGFLPDSPSLRDFIAASDKSLIGADVLVDDAPHNVVSFPRRAFLIDQPHNQHVRGITRLRDITDLPEAINHYIRTELDVAGAAARLSKALIPLAQELARGNRNGITVSDIRIEARNRGILTGNEHPDLLAGALAHVCRRAGLINFGTSRRSSLEVTHGIRQTVWFENLSRNGAQN